MTGFGDQVRRQRTAAGLTQAELATLTGLSVRSIRDLERGATATPRPSSERASFPSIVEGAVADGRPSHAIDLAAMLFRYFDLCGYYPEAAKIHRSACQAAQQTGDLGAQADALASLGGSGIWQGLLTEPIGHLEHAVAISQGSGDVRGESRSLHILGLAELLSGQLDQAAQHEKQALALFRQLEDQTGEWRALNNLADMAKRRGHYQQAIEIHQEALALSQQIGDLTGESYQLGGPPVLNPASITPARPARPALAA